MMVPIGEGRQGREGDGLALAIFVASFVFGVLVLAILGTTLGLASVSVLALWAALLVRLAAA